MAHRRAPDLSADQKQELRESFELFDAEKTGTIDIHELKVLMRALGFQVKKAQVVKYVHELDPDNDGTVSYQLFLKLMTDRYREVDPDEEVMKAFSLFDTEG